MTKSFHSCPNTTSHSLSIECKGSLLGNTVLGDAEEGSRVEEYMELVESKVELQKMTIGGLAICWDQSSE